MFFCVPLGVAPNPEGTLSPPPNAPPLPAGPKPRRRRGGPNDRKISHLFAAAPRSSAPRALPNRAQWLDCRLLHRTEPALVFLRRRLHATLSLTCSTTGKPSRRREHSAAAYSLILPNHVAEAVEAEGSPAPSAAAQFSSACAPARQVVSVLIRIGGWCSWSKNLGVRGLAWHVPCRIRCLERTIWIPHRRVFVFNLRVEQARIILLRRIRPLP